MDNRLFPDLIIARIPGLSSRERILLMEKFDEADSFVLVSKGDIEKIINRSLKQYSWEMDNLRREAEKDMLACKRNGISLVSFGSPDYPPLLRELYDPPAMLFYRGILPSQDKPMAAVVGTRQPSPAAASQAWDLSRQLGLMGISVVSGLALGIDAMAHRGNIKGGSPTIAVLGSGADEIYPLSNRALAGNILETGGALVTEYAPGTAPLKWNFPARNRIIAGLARGTVVVEAPEKSGALITAQFALDQGRDLWVASSGARSIPVYGAGTAKLVSEGAKVISSAGEILKEWNLEYIPYGDVQLRNELMADGKTLAFSLARTLDIEL